MRRDLPHLCGKLSSDGGSLKAPTTGTWTRRMSKEDEKVDGGKAAPRTFSAEDVRQGEIILRRRWQRLVFIGGLVAACLVILLLRFAG